MTENFDWTAFQDEVDYASYSLDDDKLRVFSGRVTSELYDEFKSNGWNRAYKQGCFFAKWTPRREDIALALCEEIVDEDSTAEDRAKERSERFAGYSEHATERAQDARDRSDAISRNIPFGQPILVGHHSEKRHRRDIDRMWKLTGKSVEEGRKAEYWQRRADAAIRHAEARYEPGKIARRVKKLGAEKRKKQRERNTNKSHMREYVIKDHYPDLAYYDRPRYGELDNTERSKVDADIAARVARHEQWSDRWIEHLDSQIAYWQAIYNEVKPDDLPEAGEQFPLKKGCWVKSSYYRGAWGKVQRVNKSRDKRISSVTIDENNVIGVKFFVRRWDYTELTAWSETRPEVE